MRSRSRSSLAVRSRSTLAIVALAVFASACGSDSSTPTGPSNDVRADLTQAFVELGHPAISGAIEGMSGLFVLPSSHSGCTYTAASRSFVCPTESQSGLSLAFSYTLLDASGTAQSAFGPTTTNSVGTKSVISGTVTDGGDSFSINGQQDVTLSGLLSTKHTLNGTSDFSFSGSIAGTGTFAFRTKTTIANLVLPTTTNAYPPSGTILAEETLTGGTGTDKALLTFNGTSTITVLFTYASGKVQHCTMNLAKASEIGCTD